MDSRGNIFEIEEDKKTKEKIVRNIETEEIKIITEKALNAMKKLTVAEKNHLLNMNRKNRREWFRNNKVGQS